MLHIAKLGYAAFTTADVEATWAHYTEVIGFSLVEREDDGTAYLRNAVDHHTIVLYPAAESNLHHLGFQLGDTQTLDVVTDQLKAHGIAMEVRSDTQPGVPELIQLSDPEGNAIQLYTTMEQTSHGLLDRGIAPEKLGHVAIHVRNIKKMVRFYQEVLGFRVSDWVEDSCAFLRCGPDHHTILLIQARSRSPRTHILHHAAFQLHDWAHMQRACDHLAKKNVSLFWGPGRHGPGHSLFTYHLDPGGNMVELFTDLDLMLNEDLGYFEPRSWHSDYPQRPKVWKNSPQTANLWGLLPAGSRR
ncbi:MAG: VOC family protein [Ktedonobacteraceae bacterium]|nr:VOC family protein [Ktedonobacteraceae bacterium]